MARRNKKKEPDMADGALYYCKLDTPLGKAVAATEADALTGFWFVGQKYYPQGTEEWVEDVNRPVFKALRRWLDEYFAGKNPAPSIPLALRGTPFQKSVWEILLRIPYGKLSTYGAIARQVAEMRNTSSFSAQAVGNAVGHNPISLLVPCHRVVGSNGSLTGYAGGLEKKIKLLELEGVDTSAFFIPRRSTAL